MNLKLILPLCLALSGIGLAQNLTLDQKVADFQQLAAIYAKNYGPYEWKVATQGFDLLNIGPWLERVRQSKDDLEFMDICVEYVASLNDAHDYFSIPSDFQAYLGFLVDIYDGKTIIDSINRGYLPLRDYPFAVGDELVSIDGKSTSELLAAFTRYGIAANPRSTRRITAEYLTFRPQSIMPRAHEIGPDATVVIRRQSGAEETYVIPWVKSGTPLVAGGPVITPKSAGVRAAARRAPIDYGDGGPTRGGDSFDYPDALKKLHNVSLPAGRRAYLNFGGRSPIFAMPADFKPRLGRSGMDQFYSGTFQAGGFTVGFLRIPSFSPASESLAFEQLDTEIAYMQANTDGLIVDVMRNPGGDMCYAESVLTRLIPYAFRTMGFEIRATASWIADLSSSLTYAEQVGAPQRDIDLLTIILGDIKQAYSEMRGRTGAEAICNPDIMVAPATDRNGNLTAYTKPLMVLTDELSASGADAFPAILQDNQRGPVFGMRTMGAGGNVVDTAATTYSEGSTRFTGSLMNRIKPIATTDYPTAPYVENIGVRPDIEQDYMTMDNLLNRGKSFVQAFSDAMASWIQKNHAPQSRIQMRGRLLN